MRRATLVVAVVVAAVGATAATAAAQPANKRQPEARFARLLAALPGSGFHVDSRTPTWSERDNCRRPWHDARRAERAACKLLTGSWRIRIVADKRIGKQAVVQELWLFRYPDAGAATRAARSWKELPADGPFAKHPFRILRCRDHLLAIEGRHRFPRPLDDLAAALQSRLTRLCKTDP
jgi:hypothetical protein